LPSLGLGHFDYITCLGVLHHLPEPQEGLLALTSVLAEGGAMAIMLYGAIGRAHIYAMQDLLRRLTVGLDHPGDRLAFAKKIVANLPAKNFFRLKEGDKVIQDYYLEDETNFWDTLLHEQDRAYRASEVRDFLASAGLFTQAFISYQGEAAITGLQYDLGLYIAESSDKERLGTLSLAQREDLAEALDGSLSLHTVYATRSPRSSLSAVAPDAILSPMSRSAGRIISYLGNNDRELRIVLRNGQVLTYKPCIITQSFFRKIDGQKSNAEICDLLGIAQNSKELSILNKELLIPAALHWLLARRKGGSYFAPLPDRREFSDQMRHGEPVILPL
jgi:hypothetical protein